jgi:hypothetical protein
VKAGEEWVAVQPLRRNGDRLGDRLGDRCQAAGRMLIAALAESGAALSGTMPYVPGLAREEGPDDRRWEAGRGS